LDRRRAIWTSAGGAVLLTGVGLVLYFALRGAPPTLFTGYYKNGEETRRAYRGSWYLTGDSAQLDDDGYLWFVGRADDVISSAGYRIGPFEVESALLEHPERLREEYQRRLDDPGQQDRGADLASTQAQIRKLEQGIGRLIDSYAEGFMTKEEFTPRVERLRQRINMLQAQLEQQEVAAARAADLKRVVGRLEEFAQRVRAGLDDADHATKREIIVAVVKRIEVDVDHIRVVFKVGPPPGGPDGRILRDCTRGAHQVSFESADGVALRFPLAHTPGHIPLRRRQAA